MCSVFLASQIGLRFGLTGSDICYEFMNAATNFILFNFYMHYVVMNAYIVQCTFDSKEMTDSFQFPPQ